MMAEASSKYRSIGPERNASRHRRWLSRYLPILTWLPTYQRSWLRFDLIAGITVWAVLVPEAVAYSGLAGTPPQAGLFAAPFLLLGYAPFVLGSALVGVAAVIAFSARPGMSERDPAPSVPAMQSATFEETHVMAREQ
jgi:hypothetical protein